MLLTEKSKKDGHVDKYIFLKCVDAILDSSCL